MRTVTAAVIAMFLAAGCVTEKVSPSRSGGSSGSAATLPDGPIAVPARSVSTTSRVILGITPMGAIPYDGQVLPLISPDGRFCAVQEGEPPSWSTLIAAPDAEVPVPTRLAVYDLSTSPPTRLLAPQSPEPGLMLGRACDHRGFLVESHRADGSRWIGRLAWQSGNVEWLAREAEAVCAHGTLTAAGDLVFTRRPVAGQVAELVVRTSSGQIATRAEPTQPYAMPLASSDPKIVYAMALTSTGIELQAIRLAIGGNGAPKLGPVLARRMISSGAGEALLAYQIAAPVQGPFPTAAGEASNPRDDEPLAIYSPQMGRMAIFDLRFGTLLPLAADSVAAIPWNAATRPGYLCTTPKGLVFTPRPSGNASGKDPPTPDARVLGDSYIARRTTSPTRPAILLGPVARDPLSLQLVGIAPAEEEQAGVAK